MKTFHIFKIHPSAEKTPFPFDFDHAETIYGALSDVRAALNSPAYDPGQYVILEDTSGIVTKSLVTTQKVNVVFEPSRKKPRKDLTPEQIAAKTAKSKKKATRKRSTFVTSTDLAAPETQP